MKASLRPLCLAAALACVSPPVFAEGRCPPGMYPVGGQGVGGCAPIPGAGSQAEEAIPQGPRTESRYGSIARQVRKGGNHIGVSNDQGSRRKAEKLALASCREKGEECEVWLSYANQCASVSTTARDGSPVGGLTTVGHALSASAAEQLALNQCRADSGGECMTFYSACSFERVKTGRFW